MPGPFHAEFARHDASGRWPRHRGRRAHDLRAADHATSMTQLRKVADGLRSVCAGCRPAQDTAEDILAYDAIEHQRQLHSTNPLERLNKAIKRRSNVVGIFPTPQSVIRFVGANLLEQDDEWAVAERRYFSVESMKQLTAPTLPATARKSSPRSPEGGSVWALVDTALWFPSSGGRTFFRPRLQQRPPWSSSGKMCAIYTT